MAKTTGDVFANLKLKSNMFDISFFYVFYGEFTTAVAGGGGTSIFLFQLKLLNWAEEFVRTS